MNKISLKKIAGVVVFVIATIVGGAFGSKISNYFFDGSSNGISDKLLTKQADKMNRNLPMMVDSETQLINVYGSNNTFYYNFKLVNIKAKEVDTGHFKKAMRNQVLKNYCTNPDMETFKNNGVVLQYNYKGKENNYISKITVHAEECDDI